MLTKKSQENSILAKKRHQYIRIRTMLAELICHPEIFMESDRGLAISKHMTSIGKPISKGSANRYLRLLGVKKGDKAIYQRHLDRLYEFKEKIYGRKQFKMISISQANKYCENYQEIENYDKAIADKNKTCNYHHSAETKAKISARKKGKQSAFKGKHHTDETKAKMSAKNKGKTISAETRAKMSESKKDKQLKKFQWLTPEGKIVEMNKAMVTRWHKDWKLIA